MEDEKKSKIIEIVVFVIIIVGIGTMLLISKNMNKENNSKTTSATSTTSTTKKTETTTTKVEDTSSFRMIIENIFTADDGITIDGRISQGTIHKGDKIEIVGDNKVISTIADKIYINNEEVGSATKDEYIKIHIKDINKSQVSRGQTIASPNTIKAVSKFKATIYINTLKEGGKDTPIFNNYSSLFVFKIESYTGNIILDNEDDVDLYGISDDLKIFSEDTRSVPQYVGKNASVSSSIVNQGAIILGKVHHSIISNETLIEAGAEVIDSVVMPGAIIHKDARIYKAIVAPYVEVEEGRVQNEDGAKPILISK